MAMTLTTARQVLKESVLHSGSDQYGPIKLDTAILGCGNEFVRETNCSIEVIQFTWTSGTAIINLVSGAPAVTDWHQEQFMFAYLTNEGAGSSGAGDEGFDILRVVPFDSILRRRQANDTTGLPTMLAMVDDSRMAIYPRPNDNYNLNVKRRSPFTVFTPGTADAENVTLNIPDEWIHSVLRTGGKLYMIGGAPGHPDADAMRPEWAELKASARARFTDGRPGVNDRDALPGTYTRGQSNG